MNFNMIVLFISVIVLILCGLSEGQDCLLTVPRNPLTAAGLATPYLLSSKDGNAPCSQTGDGATFVQGAIFDKDTSTISIYNPLVINIGSTAAALPVAPTLPKNAIVALWFGTNGDSVTLVDDGSGSLNAGNCVNGFQGSIFGQFAYCNAPNFFQAAQKAIDHGSIKVPRLKTANDGFPCPTTRDFFIVDQDPSDNVLTSYLVTKTGSIAPNTAANRRKFPDASVVTNGSDELLDVTVALALGCDVWKAPDLADSTSQLPALPLNELFAASRQSFPVALVPAGDPMVTVNGAMSLGKLNLYRLGVSESPVKKLSEASTTTFCKNYAVIFLTRMSNPATKRILSAQPSPDVAVGNNLYTFLARRFVTAFGPDNLNCTGLLRISIPQMPVVMRMDSNGTITDFEISTEKLNSTVWGEDEVTDSVASGSTSVCAMFLLSIASISILFLM